MYTPGLQSIYPKTHMPSRDDATEVTCCCSYDYTAKAFPQTICFD